jgi:hypothetical protein
MAGMEPPAYFMARNACLSSSAISGLTDMNSQAKNDHLALRHWFMAAIKARGLDYRNEPMSQRSPDEATRNPG